MFYLAIESGRPGLTYYLQATYDVTGREPGRDALVSARRTVGETSGPRRNVHKVQNSTDSDPHRGS